MIWHQSSLTFVIILRPSCSTKHLLDVQNAQIFALGQIRVVNVGSLDDNSIGRHIDTPCQSGSRQKNLDFTFGEHFLHCVSVGSDHTCVMKTTTELDNIFEFSIFEPGVLLENVSHLSYVVIIFQLFCSLNDVFAIFDCLSSWVNKDKDLFVGFKVIKSHFVTFFVVYVSNISFLWNIVISVLWVFYTNEVNGQRYRTIVSIEVKQSLVSVNLQKISNIVIIRQGSTQTHESDVLLCSFLGSEQSGNDWFNDPTSFVIQQVDLIQNDQMNVFKKGGSFSGGYIPFFRSCDQNVGCGKFSLRKLNITRGFTCFHVWKFSRKFLDQLIRKSLHGWDVYDFYVFIWTGAFDCL